MIKFIPKTKDKIFRNRKRESEGLSFLLLYFEKPGFKPCLTYLNCAKIN